MTCYVIYEYLTEFNTGLHLKQFKLFWADCGHRFKAKKLLKTRQAAPPSVQNEL